MTISFLFMVMAIICALLAMVGYAPHPRFNLIGAALFFYFISLVIPK